MAIGALAAAPATAATIYYQPYIDFDTWLAQYEDVNVSGVRVSDSLITGTDANGGFIRRTTTWAGAGGGPLYIRKASDPNPAHSFGLGAPYVADGYVKSEVQPLSPRKVDVLKQPRPQTTKAQKTAVAIGGLANVGEFIGGAIGILVGIKLIPALWEIVKDPPDPNYMVLATPGTPDTITLPDLTGWAEERIAALTDLVKNLELWGPLAQAMTDSIDRAQGAYDAGDTFWAAAQFAAFEDYYQLDLTYATAVNPDAVALGLCLVRPVPPFQSLRPGP
jgi:hypothetical protein